MTLEFTEGQDISVRYSLLHRIAESPSAEVWLALDRSGDERVCLKIFVVYSDDNSGQRVDSPNGPRMGPTAIHE